MSINRTPLRTTIALAGSLLLAATAAAAERHRDWVELTQKNFRFGTYVIDRPGRYRLAEDISFNPNAAPALTSAIEHGHLPASIAAQLGLPMPVDAYHAGHPLPTQLAHRPPGERFTPGGPLDARYHPAGYGLGFFAAIAITARDVVLDLNGYTLEQSAEHALLQRFFANIELANQPFIPGQGPANFGGTFKAARDVVIRNGTIGRSAHHGIHGNGNRDVLVENVDFRDYEVAAIALNGVRDLRARNVTASNRKDVPVLGTFSSVQFIKHYVEALVRNGSQTVIDVDGETLDATAIRDALRSAVNAVHADIIAQPNIVDGRAQIDAARHPAQYALFANHYGLVDGNSYSFLVNSIGVAVNGFKTRTTKPARNIHFSNVRVDGQHAFVNEVIALAPEGKAVTDPVGSVFQVFNTHPLSGQPVTVSELDPTHARYLGNVAANAQALVAKAHAAGDFEGTHLDLRRLGINADIVRWVEAQPGYETLASIVPTPAHRLCNGDSMFHVNKGAIGFRIDAAVNVRLRNTQVNDIRNFGAPGSDLCGDYSDGKSHPMATLPGYGGAWTRAYAIAGSRNVVFANARVNGAQASAGSVVGVDVLTDARRVTVRDSRVHGVSAGHGAPVSGYGPDDTRVANGFQVGPDVSRTLLLRNCATALDGYDGENLIKDHGNHTYVRGNCR